MSQPIWKYVGHLGDVNPIDYGGGFIYVDETGVYAPEVSYIEPGETEDDEVTEYRFIIEPCTYIDGVLSDNKYHPKLAAWFAGRGDAKAEIAWQRVDKFAQFAESFGETADEMAAHFTSEGVTERAQAWLNVGQYWGMNELDHYPLQMSPSEAKERFKEELKLCRS